MGEYLCLNPDAENPPYNNAFAFGETANEALQGLYDWYLKNYDIIYQKRNKILEK